MANGVIELGGGPGIGGKYTGQMVECLEVEVDQGQPNEFGEEITGDGEKFWVGYEIVGDTDADIDEGTGQVEETLRVQGCHGRMGLISQKSKDAGTGWNIFCGLEWGKFSGRRKWRIIGKREAPWEMRKDKETGQELGRDAGRSRTSDSMKSLSIFDCDVFLVNHKEYKYYVLTNFCQSRRKCSAGDRSRARLSSKTAAPLGSSSLPPGTDLKL